MKSLRLRPAFLVALGMLLLATHSQAQNTQLGRIDFPTSGTPKAREFFVRGVLLLHSFEYEDAREQFLKAQKLDPDFTMTYWAEAMTYNHPLWQEQDLEKARAALNRFAPTPEARLAKTPTEREKGYLRAVEALYSKGDKLSRDLAYAQAMQRLTEQYPDDLEARSFYALSILGTAQGERDLRIYMRAGAVAEEVFAKNPRHPGAAHYLIHSYDDPVHAPLGLRAARVYAKIAPTASHAQHMISHIYVALGSWDEVVTANEKSFAVSEERARRKGLPIHRRNHHALHWLEYAYLQKGRYRDVRRTLEVMEHDARQHSSPIHRRYLGQMRAAYLVHTRDPQDAPASIDTTGIELAAAAAYLFASGMSALLAGDPAAAENVLAHLRSLRQSAQKTANKDPNNVYALNSPRNIKVATVMEKELNALLRFKEGKPEEAITLMKEATAGEDSMSLEYGPPDVVKPSHELFGEMLLELNRPAEARRQFELALDRAPRRALSLLGLARAAARLGDAETAQRTYAELRQIWNQADADLPELREVTDSLAEAHPLPSVCENSVPTNCIPKTNSGRISRN